MGVLTTIQNHIIRKQGQIDTANARITELEVLENNLTITPEEQIELDNLRDVVLPDLQAEFAKLNDIETKLGINVGTYGTMYDIIDNPSMVTNKLATEANTFSPKTCDGSSFPVGSALQKLNDGLDDLFANIATVLDDIWADSITAITDWFDKLNIIDLNFNDISTAVASYKAALTELASTIKASEWAKNPLDPCMVGLGDKLMSTQSVENKTLYENLKAVSNDPQSKSDLIKSAIEAIKV